MPLSSNSARSTPLGGRKVEAPSYQQWLFGRDAPASSPASETKPSSPFSAHFPPPPRPMRSNSVSLELSLGQSSPTGVGSVLFAPLSDAAGFLAKAAQLSLARKDLRHTISCCNQAVALAPDCGLAWKQRGVVRLQAGEARAALEDLNMAVRLDPTDARLLERRAAARHGIRDYVGAVEDATDAIQAEGVRPEFWRRRGLAKMMLEDYTSAASDYDQALRLDPQHAGSWRNRGAARLNLGQKKAAEGDTSKAIKLHPNACNFMQRAKIRLETGDYAGAARDCTQALKMSDQADLWVLRAIAKQHLKDLPGAVADLDEVIKRDQYNYKAWERRAQIRLKQGHYEHLIRECNEAIPAMPEPGELLCCRGQAYYRKGDYKSAYDDFESALQHEPESALARKLLDMSHQCVKQLESWKLKLGDPSCLTEAVSAVQLIN
ncbi:unnamed protein product [Cladocopium goreaui]|uniref:Uncharacterized protein n=1 Tax=Cladocopium goreaui TaxID=2562237 RepID=A0A9P1CTB2_9DINO|nr:unnamed protein product [Cladocopium goreaui]|mmetsp:Transcript_20984/g.43769  ORF Transcript_20984/g.43769 Transcript_20984/m.43769 type:complete len:434 (+) Transcript_20984:32-1333(+)